MAVPAPWQAHMEAGIRQLEANLDARVVTVVNRASVEEVSGWIGAALSAGWAWQGRTTCPGP